MGILHSHYTLKLPFQSSCVNPVMHVTIMMIYLHSKNNQF